MKKAAVLVIFFAFVLPFSLTACAGYKRTVTEEAGTDGVEKTETEEMSEREESSVKEEKLKMMIGNQAVEVEWEDNETVDALRELVKEDSLTVQMFMYGGFEQVGSLGTGLPRNDAQTTTQAGDIVLYSGDQVVVFYGSNAWAYTRLGHITDQDAAGMKKLLGNGDVKITFCNSLE